MRKESSEKLKLTKKETQRKSREMRENASKLLNEFVARQVHKGIINRKKMTTKP